MNFLIDTNVISELRKGDRCHPGVARWFAAADETQLFTSCLVLGEIRKGVEQLRPRDGERAATIEIWLDQVTRAFGARLLDVTPEVADVWGRLSAARSLPVIDTLLVATAKVHDLVLVTRNVADTDGLGADILNPFDLT